MGPHDPSLREDGAVEPHLKGSAFSSGFLTPSSIGIGCGPHPALSALSPLLDLGTPGSAALEFLCQPFPALWGDFSHSARLHADDSRSLSWGPLGICTLSNTTTCQRLPEACFSGDWHHPAARARNQAHLVPPKSLGFVLSLPVLLLISSSFHPYCLHPGPGHCPTPTQAVSP